MQADNPNSKMARTTFVFVALRLLRHVEFGAERSKKALLVLLDHVELDIRIDLAVIDVDVRPGLRNVLALVYMALPAPALPYPGRHGTTRHG